MTMGLLDRILGRKSDMEPEKVVPGGRPTAEAVSNYERMLRTAPTEVITRAHAEAFEKLTPAQLDLLYERFNATASNVQDRPADRQPGSLAESAAKAEKRKPGAIARALGDNTTGVGLNALVTASIFDSIVWYAIASVAWNSWSAPDDSADAALEQPDTALDQPGEIGEGFWGFDV
jgi:hypothetical protein